MPSQTVQTGDESKIAPSSLEIAWITPGEVGEVWPVVDPLLRAALEHGYGIDTSSEEMRGDIESNEALLWVVKDSGKIVAAVTASIVVLPSETKILVEALAGDRFPEWIDRFEELLGGLRVLVGASSVEAFCRPGMARQLGRRGWRHKATIMELT